MENYEKEWKVMEKPRFLGFHCVDPLMIGIRFTRRGIKVNGNEWNVLEENEKE